MSQKIPLHQDNMIIASAGTGKTTLMVNTYLSLLQEGIDPHEIITLTFTEKAARELKERIQLRLPEFFGEDSPLFIEQLKNKIELSHLGNFHQFCFKLIKKFNLVPASADLQIINDFSREELLSKSVRECLLAGLEKQDPDLLILASHFGMKSLKTLLTQFVFVDLLKIENQDIPHFQASEEPVIAAFKNQLKLIKQDYYQATQKLAAIDFHQMEESVIAFFTQQSTLAREFSKKIRFLLVDEFQDTSPGQIKIIQSIHQMSNPCYYFLVGDPKQAIYGFRGVKQSLINDFKINLENSGGKCHYQDTNYRSHGPIVDFANRLTAAFYPETPACSAYQKEHPDAQVKIISLDCEAKIKAQAARDLQAQYIAGDIQKKIQQGQKYNDFAILYRSSTGSKALSEALKAHNIPFSMKGGQNLIDQQAILDIKNLLFTLARPQDSIALVGTLKSPFFAFNDDLIYQVFSQSDSAWKILADSQNSQIQSAYQLLTKLKELSLKLPLRDLFWEIEKLCDLNARLSFLDPKLHANLNYYQFKESLLQLANKEETYSYTQFIDNFDFALESNIKTAPASDQIAQENAVSLLTIHASKGLEFPHVYLFDNNKSSGVPLKSIVLSDWGGACKTLSNYPENKLEKTERFLAIEEKLKNDEQEEEKHLLYVAITRAKTSLQILKMGTLKVKKNSHLGLIQEFLGDDFESMILPQKVDAVPSNPNKTQDRQSSYQIPHSNNYSVRSVSELEVFLESPEKHKQQYQLGIPSDFSLKLDHQLSAAFQGTLYHNCLQLTKSKDPLLLEKNLLKVIHQDKIDLSPDEFQEMQAELNSYVQNPAFETILHAQKDYAEIPFSLLIDDTMIRGQIDRLIQVEDQWKIIDFKYSRQTSPINTDTYLFALKTYCLAASQMIKNHVGETELHTIPQGEIYTLSFTENDLREHRELLRGLLQKI